MTQALEISGVVKSFGDVRAIEDLHLVVPRGATYGLIGPSGAGKTTTIRMIMSILFPDSGVLRVLGHASALEAKDRIGYLPEERGVYRKMRVQEFLSYIARLKGVAAGTAVSRSAVMLERLGLKDVQNKRCEDLSKGMLQRVQFIAAIINEPELLILDEPFSGLDPVSVRLLKELIVDQQRRGATIIFSTHVMTQAEELCEQIVMIHRGRKVLDEASSKLRRQYDRRTILFEPLDAAADLTALRSLPGVNKMTVSEGVCELSLSAQTSPDAVIRAIAANITPARIELKRVTLEDTFIRLVAGGAADEESQQALRAHLQGLAPQGAVA